MTVGQYRRVNPRDVVICTVHGNTPHYSAAAARKHPWPMLQMAQLRRYTRHGFTVFVYGNRLCQEHEDFFRHCKDVVYFSSNEVQNGAFVDDVWPIRNWLTRKAVKSFKWIVHLDSDAFPIAGDWLPRYASLISARCPEDGSPHRSADRCFLMFSRAGFRAHAFDFTKMGVADAGAAISQHLEDQGLTWHPLPRTNRVNFHKIAAGIYDDRVYHHGAGSRTPIFEGWSSINVATRQDRLTQPILLDWLFERPDSFLNQLLGKEPPFDLGAAFLEAERPLVT
jgi:hypothetical protein